MGTGTVVRHSEELRTERIEVPRRRKEQPPGHVRELKNSV